MVEISLPKEVEEDRVIWEKIAVIGRFIGERVSREQTRDWVWKHWNREAVIKFIPKNFFIVIFKDEEVKDEI